MKPAKLQAGALAALLSVLLSSLAQAREIPAETNLSVAYGDNSQIDLGGGNVREDITFLSLMISRGWVVKKRNRERNVQLSIEGSLSRAKQEGERRVAVGATSLLQYNFRPAGKIIPFAQAGLGLLYTDLDPERFGS